jgi:hypothetical protein
MSARCTLWFVRARATASARQARSNDGIVVSCEESMVE